MNVLQIGQLPKEMGGNYTTGIARVCGEILNKEYAGNKVYFFSTNLKSYKASKLSSSKCQILGYKILPLSFLIYLTFNLYRIVEIWTVYKRYCSVSPLHMLFIQYNFHHVIKKIQPELIHLHGGCIEALHFANDKNIPIIHTHHGVMWNGDDSDVGLINSKYKELVSYELTLSDFYTTLNENSYNKLLRLGADKSRISVIPNGVDASKFYFSDKARRKVRKDLNVLDSTKVFITVGLVVNRKGQFSFLKILETLGIDFQYWIIGEGPDVEPIKQYVEVHNLKEKVKLLGYIKDTEIYKYHSAADFYAHVSTIEGQALSEIEAYSTGLRIIVRDMIANTVIGDINNDTEKYHVLNFETVSKEQLMTWINKKLEYRESLQKYDWSFIAKQYGELYNKIGANNLLD